MGLLELKKELKNLEKDEIIELIAELYKKNTSVKEYLDYWAKPNEKELFNKYKDKVFEAFYPKRGFALKLKDGKKAISDFKKLKPSEELIADLTLFYVETGVSFTNDYGDISEGFYSSLETTFLSALTIMRKINLLKKYENRAAKIVNDTRNIGWGFHDYLSDVYNEFYPLTID